MYYHILHYVCLNICSNIAFSVVYKHSVWIGQFCNSMITQIISDTDLRKWNLLHCVVTAPIFTIIIFFFSAILTELDLYGLDSATLAGIVCNCPEWKKCEDSYLFPYSPDQSKWHGPLREIQKQISSPFLLNREQWLLEEFTALIGCVLPHDTNTRMIKKVTYDGDRRNLCVCVRNSPPVRDFTDLMVPVIISQNLWKDRLNMVLTYYTVHSCQGTTSIWWDWGHISFCNHIFPNGFCKWPNVLFCYLCDCHASVLHVLLFCFVFVCLFFAKKGLLRRQSQEVSFSSTL